MRQFIKIALGSMVGGMLALFFLLFFVMGLVASLSGSMDTEWEAEFAGVQESSILKVEFSGLLQDHMQKDDLVSSLMNYDQPPAIGLYELSQVLTAAATDDKIKGLFLHFVNFRSGLANTEGLRREISEFKKTGKFVIAYAESYSENSYVLASVADEVILYPKGFFEWDGLFSKISFFKNTMAKLDVVPQIFRSGKYKSAIEPLIAEKMSEPSREQLMALIQGAWSQILSVTQDKTQNDRARLNQLASDMSVVYAKQALEHKFVNSLASFEEVEVKLKELSGVEDKPRYTSWRSYYRNIIAEKSDTSDYVVALVFAGGQIHSRGGDGDSITSDELTKTLHKLTRDEKVKAVVLRVNSPGGSALASDVIWTATQWLKESKPLVTSFGNVAASGGYYLSAGSDYIFAEASTITGSIGVFGYSFATKKFWNETVGMTFDTVKSHRFSDLESLVRMYDPQEFAKMQQVVDQIYEDFLLVVMRGRPGLNTRDEVHAVAQGRVWIGLDAKNSGLVDEIGGISQAINKAADLAKIENYSVAVYPKQKSPVESFIHQFGDMTISAINRVIPLELRTWMEFDKTKPQNRIQTRLPVKISIQ